MGQIVAKVQQQCCAGYYYRSLKQEDPCEQKQAILLQEDHKFFFKEEWFGKQSHILFYPEKFIYIYYGYRQDQLQMQKYWKQVDLHKEIKHGFIERSGDEVLQVKWKYMLRRGVPMDIMRDLMLDIFKKTYENNESEYEGTQQVVFKGQKPPDSFKHIPIFQDSNVSIEEALSVSLLTESGIQALGKICWTLHQTFFSIEYNPMVLQVANLMLIFLTEAETFCILHFMLEDSQKLLNEKDEANNTDIQRYMRWHLYLNKPQFVRLSKSFFDTIQQKSATFTQIMNHFKKIGFDYFELFTELTNNLFLGYLHFPVVLKLFIMYLNEGIKIYLRMSYALCYMLKDEILENKDPSYMKNLIKNQSLKLNQKQLEALIQKGFSLRLVKTKHKLSRYSINKNQQRQKKAFYLPILKTPSNIVKSCHLESVWEYIPSYLKLTEPTLIFSTNNNGFSLAQLYQKTEYYQEFATIFFIKTAKNDVFGFFSDQNLKPTSQMHYYGTDEIFLFKLHPKEEFFVSSAVNDCHLYSERDYFSLGTSIDQTQKDFGVALRLDSELNRGITQNCETYESKPLTSNNSTEFQLCELEVYSFIQEL